MNNMKLSEMCLFFEWNLNLVPRVLSYSSLESCPVLELKVSFKGNVKVENTATDSNAEKLSNVAFKAVIYMFLSRTICVDFSQCRLGECAIHRPITIGNTMICSYFWHLYYYMRNFCNLIGLEQWYFS